MRKDFKILLVYPNIPMMLVTPLSIAIFTWILKKEGFEVDLFDGTQYGDGELSSPQNRARFLQARNLFSNENLKLLKTTDFSVAFREKIKSFHPDLLLFSFVEDAFSRALQLLRISNSYNIPTVVGGILATSAPEWLISFQEITMLCVGEGEEVVREVAQKLYRRQDISAISNLWIKQANGNIIRNPIRPYVSLEDYSTDFSLFHQDRFIRPMGGKLHRALPIETYRGCPNRCSFCNSPMHNKIAREHNAVFLRRKSATKIRDEVAHLKNDYQADLLYFIDDSFLQRPKKEIEEFIEMYGEFQIPFWFNTRPESCTLEILKKLKDIGLFRASFGIESGSEEFRIKYMKRRTTNEKLLRYFDIIYESGIQYSINCIIGFPFETRERIFETIQFVKQIKGFDSITVSIYVPYRGTKLREVAIDAGWLDPDRLTVHTTASSMLNMPHLTAKQIDGFMRTFPLYVEFDKSVWPEIEIAERFDPVGEEMFAKYSDIYRKHLWGENNERCK